MDHHVYTIGELEEAPYINSYVGVTNNPNQRWKSHLKSPYRIGHTIRKRGWSSDQMRIIFSGTREDCFKLEKSLRSEPGIGLNEAVGGYGGYTKYTAERNAKASAALKGRKNTWIHKGTFANRDYYTNKNPNAKMWILTAPNGVVTHLHGNLSSFLKENDLAYSVLMRNQGQEVPAPNMSGYGGYRAKSETSLRQRLNTTGWKLTCKF